MKRSLILGVVAVAIAVGLWSVLSSHQSAPAITLATLQGQKLALESLRGKVVLVNFWATSCPGCIQEMPELIATSQKFKSKGVETIAVAMSYDRPDYVLKFAQQNALPFTVALDMDGQAARAFGDVRLTPTTFIIDKKGAIREQVIGTLDFKKLDKLLNKLVEAPA